MGYNYKNEDEAAESGFYFEGDLSKMPTIKDQLERGLTLPNTNKFEQLKEGFGQPGEIAITAFSWLPSMNGTDTIREYVLFLKKHEIAPEVDAAISQLDYNDNELIPLISTSHMDDMMVYASNRKLIWPNGAVYDILRLESRDVIPYSGKSFQDYIDKHYDKVKFNQDPELTLNGTIYTVGEIPLMNPPKTAVWEILRWTTFKDSIHPDYDQMKVERKRQICLKLNCPKCRVNWPKTAEYIQQLAAKGFENQSGRKFIKYIPFNYPLFSPEAQQIDEAAAQLDKEIAAEASQLREILEIVEIAATTADALAEMSDISSSSNRRRANPFRKSQKKGWKL